MMLQKPISRARERAERKADSKRTQRHVYALVTARDKRRCRACGNEADPSALDMIRRGPLVTARDKRRCRACGNEADPSALDMIRRGHHHHVRFRSAGGRDTSDNLCLLDAKCHADVHAHRLTITGNCDSTLICSTDRRTWESPCP